jgi:hypothetical protein
MKTMSAVLFAVLVASFAQAQQKWARTYGMTSDDRSYSVRQTPDSGYIVTGGVGYMGPANTNVWLMKMNASGDTLWTRAYGGTSEDAGYSVRQTSDNGYIIAGYTYSFGPGDGNVYLIKTNASGDTLWTRTYGGSQGHNYGYSVRQTSDGGYIVAGFTDAFGAGNEDVYLIKTNASGNAVWAKTYGGTSNDVGWSVQQTSDSGYIVAGYTSSFGAGNEDVYLIKTNASGDISWTRTYGGSGHDEGLSVQQTSDRGYIIAGWTTSFGAGSYDVYLIRTNPYGDTLWTRTYGGGGEDYGYSVQQTLDGGCIIAGYTLSFGAGGYDVWLIKTNASGDTLWTRTYGGGSSGDYGYSVQQTSDSGCIIAGYTDFHGAGGAYLVKTDANGCAGVEEPVSGRQKAKGSVRATPNPFISFARIPGHETERFDLYDISGKLVGAYPGNRIGEGLSPAVYFIKLDAEHGRALRIVKVR